MKCIIGVVTQVVIIAHNNRRKCVFHSADTKTGFIVISRIRWKSKMMKKQIDNILILIHDQEIFRIICICQFVPISVHPHAKYCTEYLVLDWLSLTNCNLTICRIELKKTEITEKMTQNLREKFRKNEKKIILKIKQHLNIIRIFLVYSSFYTFSDLSILFQSSDYNFLFEITHFDSTHHNNIPSSRFRFPVVKVNQLWNLVCLNTHAQVQDLIHR